MAARDFIIGGQPTPSTESTLEIPSRRRDTGDTGDSALGSGSPSLRSFGVGLPPLWMPSGTRASHDARARARAIIESIINAEDRPRNPYAIGKADEIGLMQIKPSTAWEFGVTPWQLYDPKINREVGTRYFLKLLSRYGGDPAKALMAYNGGMKNVDQGTVSKSAREYAQKVLRATESMFEGTAYAEEPPLPKGFSNPPPAGGSAPSPTEPPLPPGFANTKAEKPLPLAVRAADWAPMVGQIAGEYGAGLAATPETLGAGTIPAAMGGAFVGTEGGEHIRNAVRRHYGLPTSTETEMAESSGLSSLFTGVGKYLFTPAARGVVTKAEQDYQLATSGAQRAISDLQRLLGKTKGTALNEAQRASAAAPFKEAITTARRSAFDALGQQYNALLGPFKTNRTLGALNRAFAGELPVVKAVGMDIPPALKQKILNSPQTVQSAQEIESMARRAARGMTDSRFGPLKHALDEIAKAAHNDIKAAMPPQAAGAYDALTRRYAETVTQFENVDKIVRSSPNLPSAADTFFKQEQSQLYSTLKGLDRLPPPVRDKALDGLRGGFSNRALQAMNEAGPNPVDQFKATEKFIRSVPDGVFDRLYPGAGITKDEMLRGLERFNEFHAQILKNPDQAAAVEKALQQFVRQKPYLLHHLERWGAYSLLGLGGLAFGAHELGASAEEIGMVFGALLFIKGWNSARTSRLMLAAVKSPTAAKAATGILRALDAYGAEELKRGTGIVGRGNEEETQSQP